MSAMSAMWASVRDRYVASSSTRSESSLLTGSMIRASTRLRNTLSLLVARPNPSTS